MSIAIPSASLDFASVTWAEALREFTFHLEAARARKTVRCYAVQLKELVRWADAYEAHRGGVRFMPPRVRLFHRDRSAAVIPGRRDSADGIEWNNV